MAIGSSSSLPCGRGSGFCFFALPGLRLSLRCTRTRSIPLLIRFSHRERREDTKRTSVHSPVLAVDAFARAVRAGALASAVAAHLVGRAGLAAPAQTLRRLHYARLLLRQLAKCSQRSQKILQHVSCNLRQLLGVTTATAGTQTRVEPGSAWSVWREQPFGDVRSSEAAARFGAETVLFSALGVGHKCRHNRV